MIPPDDAWYQEIPFERDSAMRRVVKTALTNPLANFMPAGLVKSMLRFGKSELASANWSDPGGWRSMVISYDGQCTQVADRILVNSGTMPRALRNRRRLGRALLGRLIEASSAGRPHVLCLGAGPGVTILDALASAAKPATATLVDLSSDAFEYGQSRAQRMGLGERVRFLQGDVRDVATMLATPPDIVKMLGICEYLTDEQIAAIARAAGSVMPENSAILFNSLSPRHGTDRFFRRVFGLHMRHRTPEQLQELLAAGGFASFTAVPEPLGVYHLVVGWRAAPSAQLTQGSGNAGTVSALGR